MVHSSPEGSIGRPPVQVQARGGRGGTDYQYQGF